MSLGTEYDRVRSFTAALIQGLGPEDCMVQAMPDVSPPKWHLAHTTWFFETFVLEPELSGYRSPAPVYRELFNSYYEAVGPKHPRPERGQISRPTLAEVLEYRAHVDEGMRRVLALASAERVRVLAVLGLHHEEQHQELLVMDVKYNFSRNPLAPAYQREPLAASSASEPLGFQHFAGGLVELGAFSIRAPGLGAGGEEFAFDNEQPVHRRFVAPFELGTRLITNAEMLEFIRAGGYRTPKLWLSDGWAWVQQHGVEAPLYWREGAGGVFHEFTAHGELPLDLAAPVCHVSGYEADAFAAWAGARLPTEFEWEFAARSMGQTDTAPRGGGRMHPRAALGSGVTQLFGELWQWTRSAYEPYPGFAAWEGAVGEYNGKFMCGQWVLRGSSVATPRGHSRATYRNFFYPHQRWPFTGIRLARGLAR